MRLTISLAITLFEYSICELDPCGFEDCPYPGASVYSCCIITNSFVPEISSDIEVNSPLRSGMMTVYFSANFPATLCHILNLSASPLCSSI